MVLGKREKKNEKDIAMTQVEARYQTKRARKTKKEKERDEMRQVRVRRDMSERGM